MEQRPQMQNSILQVHNDESSHPNLRQRKKATLELNPLMHLGLSAFSFLSLSPKMSLLCCPQISPQVTWCKRMHHVTSIIGIEQQSLLALRRLSTEILSQGIAAKASKIGIRWSSLGGSRGVPKTNFQRNINNSKAFIVSASWLTISQIASNAFTWGTVSVLPFYSFMVLAPSSTLTRRVMESNLPYVVLGVVYAYLLYLSWTPDTLRLMFASKYWLPELPGISKMFMNEMTMASAWIHLLAVDLYAARQVFYDGMKNNIETRHSVSLCLLFCPIGILVHAITKVVTKIANRPYKELM